MKRSPTWGKSFFNFSQRFFRAFFSYFDQNQCRWETEQDNCDDYVTDSNVTFSGDTDPDILDDIDTDTNADTDADNTTDNAVTDNVTASPDTNDGEPDVTTTPNETTDTTEKPFYQNLECEPLDETWMCSSGSKNHSLCIKFCTVG